MDDHKGKYVGQTSAYALLFFKNLGLGILTLGVYTFWGRTAMQRYVWGHTELDGDRFAFHGTGMERLRGGILFYAGSSPGCWRFSRWARRSSPSMPGGIATAGATLRSGT